MDYDHQISLFQAGKCQWFDQIPCWLVIFQAHSMSQITGTPTMPRCARLRLLLSQEKTKSRALGWEAETIRNRTAIGCLGTSGYIWVLSKASAIVWVTRKQLDAYPMYWAWHKAFAPETFFGYKLCFFQPDVQWKAKIYIRKTGDSTICPSLLSCVSFLQASG